MQRVAACCAGAATGCRSWTRCCSSRSWAGTSAPSPYPRAFRGWPSTRRNTWQSWAVSTGSVTTRDIIEKAEWKLSGCKTILMSRMAAPVIHCLFHSCCHFEHRLISPTVLYVSPATVCGASLPIFLNHITNNNLVTLHSGRVVGTLYSYGLVRECDYISKFSGLSLLTQRSALPGVSPEVPTGQVVRSFSHLTAAESPAVRVCVCRGRRRAGAV